MKKLRIILLAVLLTALFAAPVFASNGDTLNIGGVVPLILDLTVAPIAGYDTLTLVNTALTPITVDIANVTIATNNSEGWELWIMSVNSDAGDEALVNDDGDTIDYTLTYAGTNGVSAAAVIATSGTLYAQADNSDTATRYADTGTLTINYDQDSGYPAGYYSDQLTIVLRAK